MRDRDATIIDRILEEIAFVENAAFDKTLSDFLDDEILQHALFMSLIAIGDCVKHFSKEFTNQYDGIAWFQIIAVRNIAAHGYWKLDVRQVWEAIVEDIPKLKEYLRNIECH